MSDGTTPQDGKAMSPASAGSHPVAWIAVFDGDDADGEFVWPDHGRATEWAAARPGVKIAPLYLSPTLTDEERVLLARLGSDTREWDKFSNGRPWFVRVEDAAILRGLLKRLG